MLAPAQTSGLLVAFPKHIALASLGQSNQESVAKPIRTTAISNSRWHLSFGIVGPIAAIGLACRRSGLRSRRSIIQPSTNEKRMPKNRFANRTALAAFDYQIEAQYDDTKALKVQPSGSGDTSLSKYMDMTIDEIKQVPLCYGASFQYIGRKQSEAGTEEDYFECNVPEIKIPGLITIEPSPLMYIRPGSKEFRIVGEKAAIRGVSEEMKEKMEKAFRFHMTAIATWDETSGKQDLRFRAEMKVEIDPPSEMRALMPASVFNQIGSAVSTQVLNVISSGFRDSFADDYKNWAESESFRQARSHGSGRAAFA